ncbi:MAG: nucleoside 2-deoxyribosyltransferase [Acidobacteriota bacterium]|nr:nucleoside 2-deoxyribosyltransferase [Acidobacteriota bacterium]
MTNSRYTVPKPFCFVLMPFSEEFDDVYRIGIKEACDKAGAYCERVDEQIFNEKILDRVYNQIAKADFLIAEMTGRNPNVFYEVGYAHALGKLTILLTQKEDDIPFDLKPFPHIVYGSKISILRDEIEKRVRYYIENPPVGSPDNKSGLELYLNRENLASGKAIHAISFTQVPHPEITIFNSSMNTYGSGDFKIGILAKKLCRCRNEEVKTTKLPTGEYLHMMPDFPTLFPNSYDSYRITLDSSNSDELVLWEEEKILVRLFTKQGNTDFPITVQIKDK